MRIDDTKIISRISKEQGVNFHEAEKAIDMFYKIIGKEIAGESSNTIEIKHLGKFIPKKPFIHGKRTSDLSGRDTNIQSICQDN